MYFLQFVRQPEVQKKPNLRVVSVVCLCLPVLACLSGSSWLVLLCFYMKLLRACSKLAEKNTMKRNTEKEAFEKCRIGCS